MGMGEPLWVHYYHALIRRVTHCNNAVWARNNYENVKRAVEFMVDNKRFALCKWHWLFSHLFYTFLIPSRINIIKNTSNVLIMWEWWIWWWSSFCYHFISVSVHLHGMLLTAPRQVTVSTVGVLKNMQRLTAELPFVNLALSLHAPNQQVR